MLTEARCCKGQVHRWLESPGTSMQHQLLVLLRTSISGTPTLCQVLYYLVFLLNPPTCS